MDLNTTMDGLNFIGGLVSGVSEFSNTLQVLLIVLGGLDIVATFLLPQMIVTKIPKIIRLVNAVLKAVKYMEIAFDKMEKTKGGFTFEKDEEETK